MHPGGIADKVGNRYEAVWLTRHLLRLVDGSALSVTIEPLGESNGFEFVVERPDHREWHQCKRQTSGSWTIRALESEGVLANFRDRIAVNADDRCFFVSRDPSKPLNLLRDKLASTHDVSQFEKALSAEELGQWRQLFQALAMDGDAALDWLRRCEFVGFPEDQLIELVDAEIARYFRAPPADVRALIRTWIEDDRNFNRPLGRRDLEIYVQTCGIGLKHYEFDATVPGKLDAANADYARTYRPIGFGLFDIERAEVDALVAALRDRDGPNIIALTAPAGFGKSVVIAKALARMQGDGWPTLVFRIDQLTDIGTLDGLGEATIAIADSPAVVLDRFAGRHPAILIVDQTDAVSEMAGRSSAARRVLLRLLDQARHYAFLKVVFSCRSFDFENDHAFQAIADPDRCMRIEIGALRWDEDVVPVVEALGVVVDRTGARIRSLLTQPIGLAIAAELAHGGSVDLGHVEHLSELYARLIDLREREMQDIHKPGWSVHQALEAIALAMSGREQLSAPVAVLDTFPRASDLLQQAGLIVVQGQRLNLMHESLFDYLHARSFVKTGKRLPDFLLEAEQTLFRRTQVRQILAQERELDPPVYIADLAFVLGDQRVRPHVRDLVLAWLGTLAEPTAEEWSIVVANGKSASAVPRHTSRVLFGNVGWSALVDSSGALSEWLGVEEEDDLRWAVRIVETAATSNEALAVDILMRFLDRRPDKAKTVLASFMWFGPKAPMPRLADVLVRALGLCTDLNMPEIGESPFQIADSWVEHAPEEAGRLIAAFFDNWYRIHDSGTPFTNNTLDGHGGLEHVAKLAQSHPAIALAAILPAMRQAMERTVDPECSPPAEDTLWNDRRKDQGAGPHLVRLIDLVRAAMQRVAADAPETAEALLALLDPHRHITALHLLLEAAASNADLHPLLAAEVDNPGFFTAGWHGAPAFSAGKAMATCWPMLTAEVQSRLEDRILRLYPEFRYALYCYRASKTLLPEGQQPLFDYRRSALGYLNDAGRTQWSTLRQLADSKLSAGVARRMVELERKFAGERPEEPDGMRMGSSRSPIAPDRAARMNDNAWVSAMTKDWSERRRRFDSFFSAGELSRVLHNEAKQDPARFLALYWTLPATVPQTYLTSILHGVAEAGLDSQQLDDLLKGLASDVVHLVDDDLVLYLIGTVARDSLGAKARSELLRIAREGEVKEPGIITRGGSEKPQPLYLVALEKGHELSWRAKQTARGKALSELGILAWHDKVAFDLYRGLLDQVIAERAPPYLVAAGEAFIEASLKHDPPSAANLLAGFLALAPVALASGTGQNSLVWLDSIDHEAARPLLLELLHGADAEMSALAAALIFGRSYHDARWSAEREAILAGPAEWRSAAAHVSAHTLEPDLANPDEVALLVSFFNDPDEGVRKSAVDVFRRITFKGMAVHADLYRGYLSSQHFQGERTYFLHRLEEAPGELDALVLELVELAAKHLSSGEGRFGVAGYHLWDPLMRLYTSNEHKPDIRKRCLDVIDALVANDMGGSDKLLAATR